MAGLPVFRLERFYIAVFVDADQVVLLDVIVGQGVKVNYFFLYLTPISFCFVFKGGRISPKFSKVVFYAAACIKVFEWLA